MKALKTPNAKNKYIKVKKEYWRKKKRKGDLKEQIRQLKRQLEELKKRDIETQIKEIELILGVSKTPSLKEKLERAYWKYHKTRELLREIEEDVKIKVGVYTYEKFLKNELSKHNRQKNKGETKTYPRLSIPNSKVHCLL